MKHNYIFSDVTQALPALLADLTDAPVVGSRAGRTRELTHIGITIEKPWRREVLVPERKCNIAAQIAETMWVLAGRNDVEWLSHYLPRAKDFSDNGETWRSGYGPRLRDWHGVDQLAEIVKILQEDPDSRRAAAVLFDPTVDLHPGKDIACNNWLSFLIRDGALDLHVAVRSNDAMWGWSGINVFEWSTLQEIVAGLAGVGIGQLHFSVTSFHLYERHWEKAQRIVLESHRTQRVEATESPRFESWTGRSLDQLDGLIDRWFQAEIGIRAGDSLLGSIDNFPEPMLRSWLRVLDWWWNGKVGSPTNLVHTALGAAARMGLEPDWARERERIGETVELRDGLGKLLRTEPVPEPTRDLIDALVSRNPSPFLVHAIRLHNEKHAAYGDSWKRRGEMLGIMANIARKVDRLGGSETADETSADTALDLMVYLAKMLVWLHEQHFPYTNAETLPSSGTEEANALLVKTEEFVNTGWVPRAQKDAEEWLRSSFDLLEKQVLSGDPERHIRVQTMLNEAYALARSLYEQQDEYRGADHE